MKNTGIVRKLDELGRVVIPKEIRRRFKINEGDYIDISTNQDTIVLRKYDPLEETFNPLVSFIMAFKEELDCDFLITDRDFYGISTLAEIRKGDEISQALHRFMTAKDEIEISGTSSIKLTYFYENKDNIFIKKVEKGTDFIGYVIISKKGIISKVDKDAVSIIKRYILMNYFE